MRFITKLLYIVRRPEFIIPCIILILVLFYISRSDFNRDVNLVKGLEVWQPVNAVDFDESWFDESCKVVVYMKHYQKFHRLDLWMNYIEKYPGIPFLFYYAGDDPVKYFKQLDEIGFKHPIMIDSEGQFYEMNKSNMDDFSFISFVINDNSVTLSNPTIPNFDKLLKECSQSIR
ncbi:MAG: hypothetical protein RLO17_20845 [Cyclobacteriaceae bacterium]